MPGADSSCPRVEANQSEVASRVARHVEYLAGRLGPRSADQPTALAEAATYVEEQLRGLGWHTSRQPVGPQPGYYNVIAEAAVLPPTNQVLVIGAHYDTVSRSPGADDNASGVAVLIEVARLVPPSDGRPVRLIGFTNEEAPLGRTELRGSLVAATESRRRGERLLGMLALESVGYFSEEPGSQRHPTPLGWLFPNSGNYLAFVGNASSRSLLHQSIAAFRATSSVATEGLVMSPDLVRHIRRSDHAPYWDQGYSAVMVTDTAEFRNPHYHEPSDLPATLDLQRLAEVAIGIASSVECLISVDSGE